jgi:hypothetical protein
MYETGFVGICIIKLTQTNRMVYKCSEDFVLMFNFFYLVVEIAKRLIACFQVAHGSVNYLNGIAMLKCQDQVTYNKVTFIKQVNIQLNSVPYTYIRSFFFLI